MSDPDVVIVGAGAAGIGAALALRDLGRSCLVLEASTRVGGRAFTDHSSLPHAWDQGCHWLHCADVNPLVAWADRLGARYERQVRAHHFRYWIDGGWVTVEEARVARQATVAAFDAVYAASERNEDVSIAQVLPDAGRWTAGVRMLLQLMASDDPERVSAAGYGDYDDTEVNWPVTSGLGDLIAAMAEGLPVRLNVPVTAIEERPGGVRVETPSGTVEARAAIVTVSTNVLTSGAIRFGAGAARDLLASVAEVPCGTYEKVAIALRRPIPGLDGTLFCVVDPGQDAMDFQVAAPVGQMLIAHMGGSLARDAAKDGPEARRAFALDRLSLGFGNDIKGEIAATGVTGWQSNPWVRGAYSYARPGHAGTRRAMIAARTGRIAFAGEAFSPNWQATAHGAYQSGRDAAERLARKELG